jgi:hypothetical protein
MPLAFACLANASSTNARTAMSSSRSPMIEETAAHCHECHHLAWRART